MTFLKNGPVSTTQDFCYTIADNLGWTETGTIMSLRPDGIICISKAT